MVIVIPFVGSHRWGKRGWGGLMGGWVGGGGGIFTQPSFLLPPTPLLPPPTPFHAVAADLMKKFRRNRSVRLPSARCVFNCVVASTAATPPTTISVSLIALLNVTRFLLGWLPGQGCGLDCSFLFVLPFFAACRPLEPTQNVLRCVSVPCHLKRFPR